MGKYPYMKRNITFFCVLKGKVHTILGDVCVGVSVYKMYNNNNRRERRKNEQKKNIQNTKHIFVV